MRITGVRSFCFADDEGRKYFIVKVTTDAGISGLGEVGIPHWGGAIDAAVTHLGEFIEGADPLSTEAIWQRCFRIGFFPADRVYGCALSAIDIALWDIKGKALGLPVYKLLGGPVRDKVVCYPHTQGIGRDALLDSCRRAVDDGWKFVRWHLPSAREAGTGDDDLLEPREAVPQTVDLFAALREAVGDDVEICLDVHTRLDTAATIELATRLEPYRPFFLEDPLRAENPSSYRTLARHVRVPIAAGEQWAGKWAFREVIEEELVRYARIDLCIAGGITEAAKIAHACETHYIDIVPHNPLGPVSAAAGVALCMALTNVAVQEMPRAPGSYATDLFPRQIGWADGYAFCRDEPGLGVELDETLADERRAPLNGRLTELHRRDGAFTNW